MTLQKMIFNFFSLLLPMQCSNCDVWTSTICCKTCEKELSALSFLRFCTETQVYYISEYEPLFKTLLSRVKFESNVILAEWVGEQLLKYGIDKDIFAHIDYWLPVPLHRRKLKERGFNQACVFFEPLMSMLGIPRLDILDRVKDTKPLFNQSPKERQDELENCFKLNNDDVDLTHKHVLICDDIYTTGSTISEVEQSLDQLGLKSVLVLVLCRVSV